MTSAMKTLHKSLTKTDSDNHHSGHTSDDMVTDSTFNESKPVQKLKDRLAKLDVPTRIVTALVFVILLSTLLVDSLAPTDAQQMARKLSSENVHLTPEQLFSMEREQHVSTDTNGTRRELYLSIGWGDDIMHWLGDENDRIRNMVIGGTGLYFTTVCGPWQWAGGAVGAVDGIVTGVLESTSHKCGAARVAHLTILGVSTVIGTVTGFPGGPLAMGATGLCTAVSEQSAYIVVANGLGLITGAERCGNFVRGLEESKAVVTTIANYTVAIVPVDEPDTAVLVFDGCGCYDNGIDDSFDECRNGRTDDECFHSAL